MTRNIIKPLIKHFEQQKQEIALTNVLLLKPKFLQTTYFFTTTKSNLPINIICINVHKILVIKMGNKKHNRPCKYYVPFDFEGS